MSLFATLRRDTISMVRRGTQYGRYGILRTSATFCFVSYAMSTEERI